jgi:hypothetical protein
LKNNFYLFQNQFGRLSRFLNKKNKLGVFSSFIKTKKVKNKKIYAFKK